MKKYISVFEMITRTTIYKVLLLLVLMMGTQFLLFWNLVVNEQNRQVIYGFETLVDSIPVIWILAIGFVLLTVILCLSGCNIGSNQGYLLRRLQVTEKAIFYLQALYNCICYLLLWASQVLVFMAMSFLYEKYAVAYTNQSIVIAFYRNSLLHSILPMEDWTGWLLLILTILACGITAANFPYQQRKGKFSIGIFIMVGAAFLAFPHGLNGEEFGLVFYPAALASVGWIGFFSKIMKKEENADE